MLVLGRETERAAAGPFCCSDEGVVLTTLNVKGSSGWDGRGTSGAERMEQNENQFMEEIVESTNETRIRL